MWWGKMKWRKCWRRWGNVYKTLEKKEDMK